MRSAYKRLGPYIRVVDIRNKELEVNLLLGVSIQKILMPSIANTVGTDMSKYKIIRNMQFAYGPVTSRNGDKISVALLEEHEAAIISQAYVVFEVIDHDELDPEYLMMWFRRPEFDRYARFKSHGSARETFDWEEMCDVELPVPSIEKQREIVKEYNTVVNRIKLNEQLNQKLEETAQALYKHWFVDFEFPIALAHHSELDSESQTIEEVEIDYTKGYKSSDGKMVWNEELEKEIPEGWEVKSFDEVIESFISKRGKSKSQMNLNNYNSEFRFPVISAMNIKNGKLVKLDTIPFINETDYEEWMDPVLNIDDVLLTSEAPLGETYYLANKSEIAISQRLYCLRTRKNIVSGWFLNLWLKQASVQKELADRSTGTTVSGIKLSELKKVSILVPENIKAIGFDSRTKFIGVFVEILNKQTQTLFKIQDLLLSKVTLFEVVEKEVVDVR